jgi:hypothetical protein
MAMPNITITVANDLYRRARIAAAERDTTVTAMLREYLERLGPTTPNRAQQAAELLKALDSGRNRRPIGPLRREELHDR